MLMPRGDAGRIRGMLRVAPAAAPGVFRECWRLEMKSRHEEEDQKPGRRAGGRCGNG